MWANRKHSAKKNKQKTRIKSNTKPRTPHFPASQKMSHQKEFVVGSYGFSQQQREAT